MYSAMLSSSNWVEINLSKSEMVVFGVNKDDDSFVGVLGYKLAKLPIIYLRFL